MPRISVITPSYNGAPWLPLCIASVADQNGVDVEHIVQDACSTDGTAEILARASGIKAYVEKDSGMYDAVNRGYARASGEILCYLNCDEQYTTGALRNVAHYFDTHPDVEVLFADTLVVDPTGKLICYRKVTRPHPIHIMVGHLPVLTSSIFIRSHVFSEKGFRFNADLKGLADSYWVIDLLRGRLRIGLLHTAVSAFTDTGSNLCLQPVSRKEISVLFGQAPAWARVLRTPIKALHRVQKLLAGCYRIPPIEYAIFTQANRESRTTFRVQNPSGVWRQRLGAPPS